MATNVINSLRKLGEEQLNDNKFRDAIETYNKLIMGNTVDINDLNMLGYSYAKNNELEKARVVFFEIIRLIPEHRVARMNFADLSCIIIQQSDTTDEKKIIELEEILGIEPTCFSIIDTLTKLYIKCNKKLRASIYGQLLVSLYQKNIDARIQMGQIYQSNGRIHDALNEFKEALNIQPDNENIQKYIKDTEKKIHDFESNLKDGMTFNLGVIMHLYQTANPVCDGVFIGSQATASNLEELKKNNITYILNVTSEIPNYFENTENKFVYQREKILDSPTSNIVKGELLDRCIEFIEKAVNEKKNVLVHCQAGISRSGAVIVAYLMKKFNMDYDTALNKARECRSCISPNPSFEKQIKEHMTPGIGVLDVCERMFKGLQPIKPTFVGIDKQQTNDVRSLFDNLYNSKFFPDIRRCLIYP
jgi:tetratricopeptide (TPR) repeat protein